MKRTLILIFFISSILATMNAVLVEAEEVEGIVETSQSVEFTQNEIFTLGDVVSVDDFSGSVVYDSNLTDPDEIKSYYTAMGRTNITCPIVESDSLIGNSKSSFGENDLFISQICLTNGTELYFTDEDDYDNFILNTLHSSADYVTVEDHNSVVTVNGEKSPSSGRYWKGEYVEYSCPSSDDTKNINFLEGIMSYGCMYISGKGDRILTDHWLDVGKEYSRAMMIWEGETCGTGVGDRLVSSFASPNSWNFDLAYPSTALPCKDHGVWVE